MQVKEKFLSFINKPLWKNDRVVLFVWMLTGVAYAIIKFAIGKYNNYQIFEWVYRHAVDGVTLYGNYPAGYKDSNHYGILFSLFIAPFSWMPEWLGIVLWVAANTLFLYYAVKQLPLSHNQKILILWYSYIELMTAQGVQQFNISVAAIIILSFVFILRGKDFWAAGLIMAGTFIKIYPIVGLAFFFFSRHKMKLILSCLFWVAVCFFVPMIYTDGFDYVVSQYVDWFDSLQLKNGLNMFAPSQNVSLLGFVRKIFDSPENVFHYSDLWLIVPGIVLFLIPYLRVSQYKYLRFKMILLANVLMFVVLFSTGSEASGYVTVMIGVALWYICSVFPNKKYRDWLFIVTLIIVAVSTTEIVPRFIRRGFITPYVFKVWPCMVVWLTICYEMIFLNFGKEKKSLK